ncbi:ribonuclease H-like domain-containing protein [Auriculariales sp. MPI-PUGE-AT-0066]|nr:ribonuclease H-like domain-containing protein [Auriculariales sp. MPI-PUGE-AT-0066]
MRPSIPVRIQRIRLHLAPCTKTRMFSTLGLLSGVQCPDVAACKRTPCPFSHARGAIRTSFIVIPDILPTDAPISTPIRTGIKRPASESSPDTPSTSEPPLKVQRTQTPQATVRPPTAAPTLRVNTQSSKVPVIVRQAMLNQLYAQFRILYVSLLDHHSTMPSEHALLQEAEIHDRTNKVSYRNACISCIAALKKRPPPDSTRHPSVGTEAQLAERKAALETFTSLALSTPMLEPLLLAPERLKALGYLGPGGDQPSATDRQADCDRCKGSFIVKDDFDDTACKFHWGKVQFIKLSGEKQRVHTCCSQQHPAIPCEVGAHVFYETDPKILHSRYPFTPSDADDSGTALSIAGLDCEMVYTTGGMRLARISVVDAAGRIVFDELVRMEPGITVMYVHYILMERLNDEISFSDFNTRFSGVTNLDDAVLDLSAARKALGSVISSQTILIGHALDNDLKALRMIHHRCVDTVDLYPHANGFPLRRALRSLVQQHLHRTIQNAGGAGHSSVEDSIAALDLVKSYLVEKKLANQGIVR